MIEFGQTLGEYFRDVCSLACRKFFNLSGAITDRNEEVEKFFSNLRVRWTSCRVVFTSVYLPCEQMP